MICLWLAGVSMALSTHVKRVRLMLTLHKLSLSLAIAAVFLKYPNIATKTRIFSKVLLHV